MSAFDPLQTLAPARNGGLLNQRNKHSSQGKDCSSNSGPKGATIPSAIQFGASAVHVLVADRAT